MENIDEYEVKSPIQGQNPGSVDLRRRPRVWVEVQSENEEAFFCSNRNATVTQKIRMVVSAKSNRRPWK